MESDLPSELQAVVGGRRGKRAVVGQVKVRLAVFGIQLPSLPTCGPLVLSLNNHGLRLGAVELENHQKHLQNTIPVTPAISSLGDLLHNSVTKAVVCNIRF